MRALILLSLFVLAGCAHSNLPTTQASSDVNHNLNCGEDAGFIDGPFVNEGSIALTIASALFKNRQSVEFREQYLIEIYDDESHWIVNQVLRKRPEPKNSDTLIIAAGGGGLSMHIAKCDGAISRVHGIR